MAEIQFKVSLDWAGSGREGVGRILTEDLELEYSSPESMGGRGVGTSPEELLVAAVASCYSATLFSVLNRAGLPAGAVRIEAIGTVSGYPTKTRFERLVVSPTIVAGDPTRARKYEQAAELARRQCFIGHTIAESVDYRIGWIGVEPVPAAA